MNAPSPLTTETVATPGPWTAELGRFDDETYSIGHDRTRHGFGRREVATVSVGFDAEIDAEQHANALLIAAAPDLLEALRHCATDEGPEQEWLNRARAAIAKAEGRS